MKSSEMNRLNDADWTPDSRVPTLSVRDLTVEFDTAHGPLRAVDGVNFDIHPGEVLGLAGESGSGKSATALAIAGLLPRTNCRIVSGQVWLKGDDILRLDAKSLRRIRGKDIGVVFQDPMTSLNPVLKVGFQIEEAIRTHRRDLPRQSARQMAVELLASVEIPDAQGRYREYPHQYSGGMRQRAMIALAIANRPSLLIADEPTTALDVTVQAQVMNTLRSAQESTGAATLLITHDLGLVAQFADRVMILYGGRVVEHGDVMSVFSSPRHPYTAGLLRSMPRAAAKTDKLKPITGQPPNPQRLPAGCAFHPRCFLRDKREICVSERPELRFVGSARAASCHFSDELTARGPRPPGSEDANGEDSHQEET